MTPTQRGDIFRISKTSNNERLSAIDFHSEKFRAIWSVYNIGDIGNIARSQTPIALFITGHVSEKFIYEMDGGIILKQRKQSVLYLQQLLQLAWPDL